MGVTIHCGKLNMDMSYSTFDRWRVQLARRLNENFGEAYNNWMFSGHLYREEDIHIINKCFETVCNYTPELTQELFDFFTMSDCEGSIGKETSKQLLPLIEKMDDDYRIGYLGVCPYNKDYVKDFFRHSVRYGAKVWWS